MIIIKTQNLLTAYLKKLKIKNIKLGFVPTMGALHQGHVSLINAARAENDCVICSIFINPTQFNNQSDFKHYPVTIEKDIEKLVSAGCDILFLPHEKEIYNTAFFKEHYNLGYLENILEGEYRPGHFQGVCQVVDILLSMVSPHQLYLGQKDYQQCMVIKSLMDQKNFNGIDIKIMPTIREEDGLAMSSRNLRLSKDQRKKAVHIYKTLLYIKENYGTKPVEALQKQAIKELEENGFIVDYVAIVDTLTLKDIENNKAIALVAASVDNIRLIDNLILN